MNQASSRLTPAHKRLIELVARRAYERLKDRNQRSANDPRLAPDPASQVASGTQEQLRGALGR